ncbi:MAG TPA: hypothetical protein VNM48_11920 [Chloroflexota bacterium]|nr:hypothetical protein [Chloroflexota bacterium]
MADRPTHIDVGPHRYSIHWDHATLDRERVRQEEVSLSGTVRYDDLVISVDPEARPSQQRRVLMHETLHAILDVTGWRNVPPEKPDCDDFLVRIDTMLLDTLQRNPHVTAWLMERE